jgi:hypothetical protein
MNLSSAKWQVIQFNLDSAIRDFVKSVKEEKSITSIEI